MAHPLLGRRLPHHRLAAVAGDDPVAPLRTARGLLLDLAPTDNAGLPEAVTPWRDRVDVVAARWRDTAGDPLSRTTALLVRPDGHVVWAAPGGDDLSLALRTWFGAPAATPDERQT